QILPASDRSQAPSRDDLRLNEMRLRKDKEQFRAPAPPHIIRRAKILAHRFDDLTKDYVAEAVPVVIIDRFEMIEIQHRNAEWASVAMRAIDILADDLEDLATIQRTCERIGGRHLTELRFELLLLRDIAGADQDVPLARKMDDAS